ncbi:hypothetical protein [Alkalibacter saccharofermentans]|uniref:Membrane domain of glycerophosphoryl diester phosphodiesterase n=1 Tax=Alkalibacter saccharofermentans DSM 14828 TaxID=1120975 RepID=A0A1M4UEA2_9FIRM|nr:hypothetical protein [Alkalibacter saccharofermentans]SHE55004.1 hypothetical protein SAMN02746064_00737 [Alkalibacter saccharofermentans DSM 14828]
MLDQLYSKKILTLKEHLLVTIGIIKSSISIFLYLAAIPFISYSFLFIYMGDGTVEAVLAIPDSIITTIFLLNFVVFLIMIPFVMIVSRNFIENRKFAFLEIFVLIGQKLFMLLTGFLMLLLGFFALSLLAGSLFSLFSNSVVFMMVYIAIMLSAYMNVIFWSHFVVLENTRVREGFVKSHQLLKRYAKHMLLNLLIVVSSVFLILNGVDYLLSLVIRNAMISNLTMAFLQSILLIITQVFITSMFINFTKQSKLI